MSPMNMIGRAVLVAALALGLLGCEKTKTDNNKQALLLL